MPRAQMQKNDIESRLYKLKTSLYNGDHQDKPGQWHDGYHHAINQVLDIINEYRQ